MNRIQAARLVLRRMRRQPGALARVAMGRDLLRYQAGWASTDRLLVAGSAAPDAPA